MKTNIETFIGATSPYKTAEYVVFGAPFDSTTSFRPGTRFASRNMRLDSWGLETYSPYLDRDMSEIAVFDGGDIELSFGNVESTLKDIEDYTQIILNDEKKPFMIGGEHLVTLGTVRALAKKYSNLHIIHFDAHTDLREHYLGNPLSHACVIRRVWELVGDSKIYQFGIRSGEREEFEWAKQHTIMQKFNFNTLPEVVGILKESQVPVYITIDLDVLDPSVFPGTGTPEPGGVNFHQLLNAVHSFKGLNVVGCDLTELSPPYDTSGASTAVSCKIFRELLLSIAKQGQV